MFDYSILPEHMRGGMKRYLENGVPPGGFLTAVLANDLMGAIGKADQTNSARLRDFARFVYNEAPTNCHGSYQIVEKWCKDGGMNRTT